MKKYISVIIITVIVTLFLFTAKASAYENFLAASVPSLAAVSDSAPEESLDEEEMYRQQNDAMIKNIMLIQGAAIGALLLLFIIITITSFVHKKRREKTIAEKQAAYDREKREREEKEKKDKEEDKEESEKK